MTSAINYTPWIFGFSVFQFAWSTVIAIYVWYSNKEKVTNTRFSAQDERITKIETDIQLGKSGTDAAIKLRKTETDAETKLREERHLGLVKRLEEIAVEVARHADCKHHHVLEQRLDNMNGSLKKVEGVIEGRMEGIGSALDMIQQHLISGGNK